MRPTITTVLGMNKIQDFFENTKAGRYTFVVCSMGFFYFLYILSYIF